MSLLTEHFSREEFACHDGTPLPEALVPDTIRLCKNLEVLRAALGKPITILSGYRSPEHNGAVNGADHSLHLVGKAADIVVNGYKPADVHAKIEELIAAGKMEQGGLGAYNGWTHYDVRGFKARWSKVV
mgnify:FL=1